MAPTVVLTLETFKHLFELGVSSDWSPAGDIERAFDTPTAFGFLESFEHLI